MKLIPKVHLAVNVKQLSLRMIAVQCGSQGLGF